VEWGAGAVIVALAAIAITQQGSLFARTFPNPTGSNGWEEYLMAADMMTPEASRVILGAGAPNRLTVARTALKSYGRVCDLIRAGNKKPLKFPWEVDHYYAGHVPAYAALKEAARVLAFEADVAFADGKPGAAARPIKDALEFSRRIQGKAITENLISIALQAMAMRTLDTGLPQLGLEDARMLRAAFENAAGERSVLIDLYVAEFGRWEELIAGVLADPDSILFDEEVTPEFLRNLTPDQVQEYAGVIQRRVRSMQQQAREMFEKEERFWKTPDITDDDPVVAWMLSRITLKNITGALVRNMTQLRLASVHCRIIEFKRTNNRLPATLSELAAPAHIYDGTTGGPYFYAKLSEQSYLLYSLGTSETGRIDLVYSRYLDDGG